MERVVLRRQRPRLRKTRRSAAGKLTGTWEAGAGRITRSWVHVDLGLLTAGSDSDRATVSATAAAAATGPTGMVKSQGEFIFNCSLSNNGSNSSASLTLLFTLQTPCVSL